MKYAEVKVNKRYSLPVNDKEHSEFKVACALQGREMAEVVRELMRDYVKRMSKR